MKKKKASGKDFLFRCLLFGSSLERGFLCYEASCTVEFTSPDPKF